MKEKKTEKSLCAPSAYRIPELDGFRTLLVFIVSWFHIWQQSWLSCRPGAALKLLASGEGALANALTNWLETPLAKAICGIDLNAIIRTGYLAVDGTILLSGFLLFLPHARAMLTDERVPDTRGFYRRRVMRIVPSYYFSLLAIFLLVALPQQLYASPKAMWRDIITHLTFTQTFSVYTYAGTKLGGASWTIAVEMAMYLIMPLLAAAVRKRPKITLFTMAAAGLLFRGFCLWLGSGDNRLALAIDLIALSLAVCALCCTVNGLRKGERSFAFHGLAIIAFAAAFLYARRSTEAGQLKEYGMLVNQLAAFLDVYAIGMAAAVAYVRLCGRWDSFRHKTLLHIAATLCFFAGIVLYCKLAQWQYHHTPVQAGQMLIRLPLALALCMVMLSLPFCLLPVRRLFGNRLTKFLAAISMNYYLLHQTLAVQLKLLHIPPYVSESPNAASELSWQVPYTLICFGGALLLAIAVTYLVEKPCAKALSRLFERIDKRKTA